MSLDLKVLTKDGWKKMSIDISRREYVDKFNKLLENGTIIDYEVL